jgi:hypothetical protein
VSRVLTDKFPSLSRSPIKCLHHLNVHLSTCRHESSCRLWCAVASHRRCPLLYCRPSLLQLGCRARSSTTRSRAGCLVSHHPILSLLADDYRPYRHLTSATLSPFHCSVVPSLHGQDARARSSTAMSRVAPLLPHSLLTPRVAHLSLAPHCVGTMRWHAYVCHAVASIHPLLYCNTLIFIRS